MVTIGSELIRARQLGWSSSENCDDLDLHRQGLSISAIARRTGRDPKTVRKYIERGLEPPAYRRRRAGRPSKLAPLPRLFARADGDAIDARNPQTGLLRRLYGGEEVPRRCQTRKRTQAIRGAI